jgi:acetyl-CoA carboxylase biotin carboxyl carrier protein
VELKQIKELMAAMERAGIKKASIKEKDGFEVHLERHDVFTAPPAQQPHAFPAAYHPPFEAHHRFPSGSMPHHPPLTSAAPQELPSSKEETKAPGKYITSPMVGTFYSSPSPEDPIFVKVGDKVDENTVVCIIEAMKVMNEVKAGISGVLVEICVENAHPVEFGTKLFRVQ